MIRYIIVCLLVAISCNYCHFAWGGEFYRTENGKLDSQEPTSTNHVKKVIFPMPALTGKKVQLATLLDTGFDFPEVKSLEGYFECFGKGYIPDIDIFTKNWCHALNYTLNNSTIRFNIECVRWMLWKILLLADQFNFNIWPEQAFYRLFDSLFKLFLLYNIDITSFWVAYEMTPLKYAISKGNFRLCRILLQLNADTTDHLSDAVPGTPNNAFYIFYTHDYIIDIYNYYAEKGMFSVEQERELYQTLFATRYIPRAQFVNILDKAHEQMPQPYTYTICER